MSYYGVNGVAKNLLQSYLSHRHQVVDFNGSTSDTLEIKTGVPRVLCWGLFFFQCTSMTCHHVQTYYSI